MGQSRVDGPTKMVHLGPTPLGHSLLRFFVFVKDLFTTEHHNNPAGQVEQHRRHQRDGAWPKRQNAEWPVNNLKVSDGKAFCQTAGNEGRDKK